MTLPMLSLVVPVRNEAAYIERCLESLMAQDFAGHDYEILVIDGMSEDGTAEKIQNLKSKYPKLRLLKNPKKTVSSGVNVGIRNSTGQIIFRLDAHALYAPDYVHACLEVLEQTGAANVGGTAIPLPGDESSQARAVLLVHLSPFGLGGGAFRRPGFEGYTDSVWPGCFAKKILEKVGLFDERLTRTEDIELNTRIISSGGKIYISPKIKSYYICRAKVKDLLQQRWLDGIGVIQTMAINPRAPKLRHFVPLAFVLSLTALSVLSLSASGFGYLLLTELGLYFGAMLFFILKTYFDFDKYIKCNIMIVGHTKSAFFKSMALLPIVFLGLHLSYGLGSLWALLSLPGWWGRFRRTGNYALN